MFIFTDRDVSIQISRELFVRNYEMLADIDSLYKCINKQRMEHSFNGPGRIICRLEGKKEILIIYI